MTRRKDPQPDAVEAVSGAEAAEIVAEPSLTEQRPADLPPAPLPTAPPRRLGVLGPLVGGALAALGGFALSHFDVLGFGAPDQSAEMAALTKRLDDELSKQVLAQRDVSGELASTIARVAKLEAAPAPEAPDLSRLDDLDRRLGVIEALPTEGGASTAALTAKLAELERRLAALPANGTSPELQAELDAAVARLNEAEAAATARAAEVEAAAIAAAREQALDALADAVLAGGPYTTELQAVGDPISAEMLGPMAETGVPTLAKLQAEFPDAAREALRIAREISAEDGWGDRLVDFLASQTGARSLTPREGDGPDAVLSRADFALSEGRVADALAELDALAPAVKAPLAAWIGAAGGHLLAETALKAARGE